MFPDHVISNEVCKTDLSSFPYELPTLSDYY